MRLSKILERIEDYVRHIQFNYRDFKLTHHYHLPALTRSEFTEVKKTWPCFKIRKLDLGWTRVYKMKKGFSPWFLNDVQYAQLLKRTNPLNQVAALQNKAMCDVYFPEIPYPKVFVRCLNGVLYDGNMNQLTLDETCFILSKKDVFFIKPSVESRCGCGVRKIKTDETSVNGIKKILNEAGLNFIVQEQVIQHPLLSKLNESSLNCCRVTTIWLKGKFDYTTVMKIGKKGALIDNWNSAYWTNVSKEGILGDIAYDHDLVEVRTTDNGFVFGGMEYPNYRKMIDMLEHFHKKYFANIGIIGWDVVVDVSNEIKVIEPNLYFGSANGSQLCCGCFYEQFHDEICEIMSYEED